MRQRLPAAPGRQARGEGRGPALRDAEVVEPESAPGRSILVIDDEEAVLDVVRRFLQIAGHQVTVATSGQEALELLSNGRPVDLVILDLMMPREDVAGDVPAAAPAPPRRARPALHRLGRRQPRAGTAAAAAPSA